MAYYSYRAKTQDGKIVEGSLEVENEETARAILAEQGLMIMSLDAHAIYNFGKITIFDKRVTRRDLVIFSRQLAVMAGANIPIVRALKILSSETQNESLSKILTSIMTQVGSGTKLSDAISSYHKVFDGFYINMIRSGESSGKLDEVLNYLADQLEKDYDLAKKIKGALMYPITVVISMIIASVVVLVYVIPRLVLVFQTIGVDVPWTTSLLISISNILRGYWWVGIIVIVLIFFIGRAYVLTQLGRGVVSSIKLRLPIFGRLFSYIYILQITRGLNTLLAGGVNLYESLVIVADVVQDIQYKKVIHRAIDGVRDGGSLAVIFASEPLIPELVRNMITVGEQTGKLDYMLEKLSDYYTKEIDGITVNIMTLIEPLVMIILGVGVALLVSAVFLPLYTIPSF